MVVLAQHTTGATGLLRLAVLNDFVAQALAVAHLDDTQFEAIGPGRRLIDRPAVVLGPGTGLGCAMLLRVGGQPMPLASEAGHMSFAPEDALERRLLDELAHAHGHVSFERVLSGPGLVATATTLARIAGDQLAFKEPGEVVRRAREAGCPHCNAALRLFSGALGAFAGNLALAALARGGVFLVGSLLGRLGDRFDRSFFRQRFEAKGRLAELLREVATVRVLPEQTGLLGASWFAFE